MGRGGGCTFKVSLPETFTLGCSPERPREESPPLVSYFRIYLGGGGGGGGGLFKRVPPPEVYPVICMLCPRKVASRVTNDGTRTFRSE